MVKNFTRNKAEHARVRRQPGNRRRPMHRSKSRYKPYILTNKQLLQLNNLMLRCAFKTKRLSKSMLNCKSDLTILPKNMYSWLLKRLRNRPLIGKDFRIVWYKREHLSTRSPTTVSMISNWYRRISIFSCILRHFRRHYNSNHYNSRLNSLKLLWLSRNKVCEVMVPIIIVEGQVWALDKQISATVVQPRGESKPLSISCTILKTSPCKMIPKTQAHYLKVFRTSL